MMIGYIVLQFTVPHCSFIMIRYKNLTGTKIYQQANSSTVTSSQSVKYTELSENHTLILIDMPCSLLGEAYQLLPSYVFMGH